MRVILFIIFLCKFLFAQTSLYSNPDLPLVFVFNEEPNISFWYKTDSLNKTSIYSDYLYNQIYYEKSENRIIYDIGNWYYNIGVNKGLKVYNTPFLLNTSYSQNKKFLISNTKGNSFSYIQNNTNFYLNIYTTAGFLNIHTGLNIQQYRLNTRIYPSVDVNLNFTDRLNFGYGFKSERNDWNFSAKNSNNIIEFEQVEYRVSNTFNLNYMLKKGITLKTVYKLSELNPGIKPENNVNMIAAKGQSNHIFIGSQFNHILGLDLIGINFQVFNLSSNGHFYSNKQIFGKITTKTSSYYKYNLDFNKKFTESVLIGNLSVGETKIKARGYGDTWPYSSYWTDLLGLRYWADGDLKYNYISGSVEYKKYFYKNSFYKVMFMYEQIQPEGLLKTWQPEFLVFGIRNLQTNKTIISRQHGLYIKAGLMYYLFRNISLNYQLSQYIPVFSEKIKGTTQAAQKSKSQNKIFKYGGGQHTVKLCIQF